jgi:hypothetical protein
MRTMSLLRVACAPLLLALAVTAHAVPPTREEVAKLCAAAEGPAHCGRLVEETQLKRLPGLARRDGNELHVTLFPTGTRVFADTETRQGGKSFALWDYLDRINAVVLFTTEDDRAGFLLLQRTNGRTIALPAEPVLSPDRQRLATADFCATQCDNELVVWRVTRDGVRREVAWKPRDEKIADATVRWTGDEALALDYTRAGDEGSPRKLERRLADGDWQRSSP